MPVNRAPAHARRLGNVIQASAGNAFFGEYLLRRIKQTMAGGEGFFLGAASHGGRLSKKCGI
jgi:hypothetical protein